MKQIRISLFILSCIVLLVPQSVCAAGEEDEDLELSKRKYLLAHQEEDQAKKSSRLLKIGSEFLKKRQMDSVQIYIDLALEAALLSGDMSKVANCYSEMGLFYFTVQNYHFALEYFEKYLAFDPSFQDSLELAATYYRMGTTYMKMGEFQLAFEFMIQALPKFEKLENKAMIARANYQMGNIFFYQENYEQAEKYYNLFIENVKENEEIDSRNILVFSGLGALGSLYSRMERHDISLEYNQKALDYAREHKMDKRVGYALHNIGTNYYEQKKYGKALRYLNEALNIKIKHKDFWSTIPSYELIAEVYLAQEQYRLAIEQLDKGLEIAKSLDAKSRIIGLYDTYAKAHRGLGEYDEAFNYIAEFVALKDSLINETSIKEMGMRQSTYEIQKRENEITMLRSEKLLMEKNQQLNRMEKMAFFLAILFLASFGGLFYNRYRIQRSSNQLLAEKNEQIRIQNEQLEKANRSRAATNQLLEDKNQQLEIMNEQVSLQNIKLENSNEDLKQFAYVASHDLREPLRMIGSYTTLLKKRNQHLFDDSANEFMGFITDAIGRMDKLLIDLLEYSRVNTQPLTYDMVSTSDIFEIVAATFAAKTKDLGAEIIVDYNGLPTLKASKTRMTQLFQNLVANALKFTDPERPAIVALSCKEEEDSYVFAVSDNGIGISKENQTKIFDMFRRLHTRTEYEGSGIGLSTVKKIVDKHQGEIWVESEVGVGSTFFIRMPKKMIEPQEPLLTGNSEAMSLPVN